MFTHRLMIIWAVFTLLLLCCCAVTFSCSVVSDSATPWTATHQASLPFAVSWSMLKLVSIESVMSSNQLTLCCRLLLLPSIFPSIRIFSSEFAFYIRWPKYWSFSFSISPFSEYSGLLSFRIDWFDFPAVQMKVKVAQSCLTLCNPMDCSLPCFSVHGILQAKVLKVGSHSLLQDIVSTQGSNPSLPHCRWILYRLSHQGSPAVQGILKSLLKHHNLKASVLPCSAFFIVQLSHTYITTGKPVALPLWTFVGKVMSAF